jgi:hypothetical protein
MQLSGSTSRLRGFEPFLHGLGKGDGLTGSYLSVRGKCCLITNCCMTDLWGELLVSKVKKIQIGPGIEEDTIMGPLVSEDHRKTVESYIAIGLNEGAAHNLLKVAAVDEKHKRVEQK